MREAAEPEIDPAEFTYLVAAFAQDDQRQAWLYDRLRLGKTLRSMERVPVADGKTSESTGQQ